METLDEELEELMSVPEVVTKNSRSESAKKMWERRKAKKESQMKSETPIKAWVYHSEWFALMSTLVVLFVWVHHESVHTNDRLDNHMEAINRRTDQISADTNRRCDELHKEFYDLLKEMRKEGK